MIRHTFAGVHTKTYLDMDTGIRFSTCASHRQNLPNSEFSWIDSAISNTGQT